MVGGWARLALGFLVVGIVGLAVWTRVGGSDPVASGPGPPEGSNSTKAFSQLPAYRGVAYADALQGDQQAYVAGLRTEDGVGLTAQDYAGLYTTVVDDVRTTPVDSCRCPSVSLWLTGGSAAFGLGQRDGHTLAAGLARLARQDGIALKVTNLGVPGRTLWNEYSAVSNRLERSPASAPDLIVSYGGYNDAVGALASAAVGKADPADPNVLDSRDLAGWEERGWVLSDSIDMDAVAALSAARYQRVIALLDELASSHGIDTHYVVQPDALASSDQFEPVAEIYRGVPVVVAHQVAAQLHRVASELAGVVLDLRHLHDDHPRSVFVDWAHANEEGAALAAEAVYDHLRPTLRDLASRP